MNRRRWVGTAGALVTLALRAAACSGGDGDARRGAVTTTAPPARAAAPAELAGIPDTCGDGEPCRAPKVGTVGF